MPSTSLVVNMCQILSFAASGDSAVTTPLSSNVKPIKFRPKMFDKFYEIKFLYYYYKFLYKPPIYSAIIPPNKLGKRYPQKKAPRISDCSCLDQ